jgi:phosphorylcholine metabolism protein LicD
MKNGIIFFIKHCIKYIVFHIKRILNVDFILFISIPFDFHKPMPKEGEAELVKVCLLLSGLSIKYRITDGTALGLYRDGNFIPHDTDLDFDILDFNEIKAFKKEIFRLGYKLGLVCIYKGKIQQLVFYNEQEIIIDFSFWVSMNNYIYVFQEKNYERKQHIKFFNNQTIISFHGNKYPIPGYIEEWLEIRYGNDWRIPKKYKVNWQEEINDMSKIQ